VQDGRSRVTVVGARKRVDVAVPSAAPLGEYVSGLADLCGQERRSPLPAAWSLARAGAAPFPPGASLAEAGVTDGQVLYLRDIARDPSMAPVVEDVDELVIGEAQRLKRQGTSRGLAMVVAGLVWIIAAAVFLSVRPGSGDIAAAVSLAGAGLILLTVAWAFELRQVKVPTAVCLAMSLVSIPCLAVAGALLAESMAGPMFLWAGAIVGCNAATALTLAATPEAAIFALQLQFGIAALLAPLLIAVRADGVQAAAAAAVAALALLAVAKPVAATIVALTRRARPDGSASGRTTTELLIRSGRLVPVVVAGPFIALAIALPVLARSQRPYGMALAVAVSVALLLRARQSVLRLEAVLVGAAGVAGIFALLTALVELSFDRWWAVVLLVTLGLGLIGIGAAATVSRDEQPSDDLGGIGGPPRRQGADVLGTACAVLSAPLALGAFGILNDLLTMGRDIVR
jgi:type VII secretion integral membrane protein EccD